MVKILQDGEAQLKKALLEALESKTEDEAK